MIRPHHLSLWVTARRGALSGTRGQRQKADGLATGDERRDRVPDVALYESIHGVLDTAIEFIHGSAALHPNSLPR